MSIADLIFECTLCLNTLFVYVCVCVCLWDYAHFCNLVLKNRKQGGKACCQPIVSL